MASEKYMNKYRIASTRKPGWDYRREAVYFVTFCTHKRLPYFGRIVNGNMQFSDLGHIATRYWNYIPNHFPFIELINFVVMPNHIHGLVGIIDNLRDVTVVETLHATSLRSPEQSQQIRNDEKMAGISPKRGSLSSVIRSYKSAVTRYANQNNIEFGWQTRYHDHIVQNDDEFVRINKYITINPRKWDNDDFNIKR
jgi:REP element-mobilizing transposase RayT